MALHSYFKARVRTAFFAAVIVVAALSVATWILVRDVQQAAQWVDHAHKTIGSLSQIRASSLAIELDTQNFRILGNPIYIVERDNTIAEREKILHRLNELTAGEPWQQKHWLQLRAVIDERLAISRRVQELRNTEGMAAASTFVAKAPLLETRQRLYRLLQEMEGEANRQLNSRYTEQRHTAQILALSGTLLALVLCVLLSVTYCWIRRQLLLSAESQRALVESEENLAITLHSIGDAVLATDAEGRICRMNAVAEVLTGWRFDEVRGRSVEDVLQFANEQTLAPVTVPVRQVLATGIGQGLADHTVLIDRNGKALPIADNAAPIHGSDGKIRGVVLVFRDVSAERQAERQIVEQNALLEQRVRERTAELSEREAHLRNVTSNLPALIAYVDAEQRYVYANEQYRMRFAPERPDIIGYTVSEILGPERYAIAAPLIAQALQGIPQSYDWQPFPGVWHAINYAPMHDSHGCISGYYVLGTDISARKEAEVKITSLNDELAQHINQLEHVSRALKTLSAGNRAMLRAVDEQALLETMCTAIVEVGGYDTAIVWYRLDDPTQSLQAMAESGYPTGLPALRQLKATWADNEYGQGVVATAIRTEETCVAHDIRLDPNYAPWRPNLQGYASAIACPLRVGGEIVGALSIYDCEAGTFGTDEIGLLTESADDLAFGIANLRILALQQKNQEAMFRLTHNDPLTGLPNETQFTEWVDAALATARPFVLLQANVERLSEINDALGFAHGDQMLCEFGARLGVAAPAPAMVARLRGDEFAILLPEGDASAAMALVQRLEGLLKPSFAIADIPLDVSARMGIVLCPEHGNSPHDLYRHMDIALHQARKSGARCAIFNPAQHADQSRRLTVASELRRAIESGDLALYLQPKVAIASGLICGVEGLVRWRHAERGLILPNEFIGLAESTGLIKPLTEWVVEAAMRLNRTWEQQGCALPIAVNLSAYNLRDEKLLDKIRYLYSSFSLAPGLLEIELTESGVMEDAELALQVLHRLREQGIPLYIDDFGTGYSSLSYLQKLPVEHIKIDQSFVRNMASSKDSEAIVRSTIDLVHDLGCKVVAEGIETRQDWDHLAALGCDIGQGFFIAKPMPAEDFQDWARRFRATGVPA